MVKLRPRAATDLRSRSRQPSPDDECIIVVNVVLRPPGGAVDVSVGAGGMAKIALQKILAEVEVFVGEEQVSSAEEIPIVICGGLGFTAGSGAYQLKKNLANKIFGYLARCEFWAKLGLRFWILVG